MICKRLWSKGALQGVGIVAAILVFGPTAHVSAGNIYWTGGNATWFETNNWNLGRVPAGGVTADTAVIQNNGTTRIEAPGAGC